MPKLDSIFGGEEQQLAHPLLRHIEEAKANAVSVEVVWPRELLGHKPAKLFVSLTIKGVPQPPQEYSWDDELNLALVARGYRAVSLENEKVRLALMLRGRLRTAETRFGDGFFYAVLVLIVRDGPLVDFAEVADVMKDVFANKPYMDGSGFGDCSAAIQQVLRTCATDLSGPLKYAREEAEGILAGAVARYLDERFTVTDRRRLGWT